MASGKPRKHRGVSNRAYRDAVIEDLRRDNEQLRLLVTHKKLKTDLWKALFAVVETVGKLDGEQSPLKSNRWDGVGTPASVAIFPGVSLADDGADADNPDGDGETNLGDRNLRHAGAYSAALEDWVLKMLQWIPRQVDYRLTGKQKVNRPSIPRRAPEPIPVKDSGSQSAHG